VQHTYRIEIHDREHLERPCKHAQVKASYFLEAVSTNGWTVQNGNLAKEEGFKSITIW